MGQPQQQQAVPGIQSEMTPVPDCGEESYVGTGQLTGKIAVVTGAPPAPTPGSVERWRSRTLAKARMSWSAI